eukprot:Skav221676  [mRNA]  locus=scaffold1494:8885:13482:+ [translate_table: standard]
MHGYTSDHSPPGPTSASPPQQDLKEQFKRCDVTSNGSPSTREALSDPSDEVVREWTGFFMTHAGGSMPFNEARKFALNTLARDHPDLDELKAWATFLRSHGGGSMGPIDARKTAWKLLSGKHPSLEDWKAWAEFFRSHPGGSMNPIHAKKEAFKILQSSKPPSLDEVKSLATFFRSRDGGSMSTIQAKLQALKAAGYQRWVSGQELVALAFSHGEQLQLNSVLKLCTYLAQRPAATRVSKRLSLVEDFEEEQMSHGGAALGFHVWGYLWGPGDATPGTSEVVIAQDP